MRLVKNIASAFALGCVLACGDSTSPGRKAFGISAAAGATHLYEAVSIVATGDHAQITWTSSDTAVLQIVRVSADPGDTAIVRFVSDGDASITAKSGDKTQSLSLQALATTLTIEAPQSKSVIAGADSAMVFSVRDAAGNAIVNPRVTLVSSDPSIVSVTGLTLHGLKVGTATVTVSAGTATSAVSIAVRVQGGPFSLDAASDNLPLYEVATVTAASSPGPLTWVSSDTAVLQILRVSAAPGDTAIIRLVSDGSATLTAQSGSEQASRAFHALPTQLRIVVQAVTVRPGAEKTLFVNVENSNDASISNPRLITSSNDQSIATVGGLTIHGVSPGDAAVTVSAGNASSAVSVAVRVPGTAPAQQASFTSVSAAGQSTCARSPDSWVYCWGRNILGQLGSISQDVCSIPWGGPTPYRGNYCNFYPTPIDAVAPVYRDVHQAGDFACALDNGGSGWCWGAVILNPATSLGLCFGGDETFKDCTDQPTQLPGALRFASLAEHGSCGVTTTSSTYCWSTDKAPYDAAVGYTFAAVDGWDVRYRQPCAVKLNHDAFCGGENEWRQVLGNHLWSMVRPGLNFVCGLTLDGSVYCWGEKNLGSNSSLPPDSVPQLISSSPAFVQLSVAEVGTACALTATGDAYCWGNNASGQLGIGVVGGAYATPTLVTGGLHFSMISVGLSHVCALTTDGQIYCWGDNTFGQLGTGTQTGRASPTPIQFRP
jgi:alpha-tubulin suppressor-like RCC1 family protein